MSAVESLKAGLGVKWHGIPVVAVGAPIVILGVVVAGRKSKATAAAGAMPDTTSGTGPSVSPTGGFTANNPPGNLAYIDPVTGRVVDPAGNVYAPVTGLPDPNSKPVAPPVGDGGAGDTTPQTPTTTTPSAPSNKPATPVNTAPNYGWFDSQSKNNTTANIAAKYGISEKALLDLNPGLKAGAVPLGLDVKIRTNAVATKSGDLGIQYHPTATPTTPAKSTITPVGPVTHVTTQQGPVTKTTSPHAPVVAPKPAPPKPTPPKPAPPKAAPAAKPVAKAVPKPAPPKKK